VAKPSKKVPKNSAEQPQPNPVPDWKPPMVNPSEVDPASLLPSRFVPLDSVGAYKEGPGREGPGGRVSTTGRIQLNVSGTGLVLKSAGNPTHPESYGIFWAADLATSEVAGVLLPGTYPKLTPIRLNPKENTMVVYLNDIFKKHPQLRPNTEQSVTVADRTEQGKTFFVVQLGIAVRRTKGPRAGEAESPEPAPAPKKAAPDAAKTEGAEPSSPPSSQGQEP